MASYYLCPLNWQQISAAGAPVSGGFIYTYQAGTSTPVATYTDNTGATPQANPIQLNTRGVPSSPIWMLGGQAVKFVIQDASNVTLQTFDNVLGINDQNAIASSTGSSLVGFLQSGTGAVARTAQDKLREAVSVKDFGAVGDGVTDDTAAFLAAATSLGSKGGTIKYFDKHLIDQNITIPSNVTIEGPMRLVGSPGNNSSAPYGNMAALILNSLATITFSGGSGVVGVLAYRKGMTFPAADASAYAGTCFTAGGDDVFVVNSMILGFNKAYYSTGYQRPRIQNLDFDCVNGVDIQNCADISRVQSNQGWPFATIAAAGTVARFHRAGTAFNFGNVGDWGKCTDNFCYGYLKGYVINNCNSVRLISCAADGTNQYAGQIGFTITGTSTDAGLIGCQASGQDTGYYINTTGVTHTKLTGCDAWNENIVCAQIDGGDAHILGGSLRDTPTGLYVNNASSVVYNDFTRYASNSSKFINVNASNPNVVIGRNNHYYGLSSGTSPLTGGTLQTIASADPLLLPERGDVFFVSGTSNFGSISGGALRRQITLIFQSALTVGTGGAAPSGMLLASGANFVAAANSSLSLVYNGSQWIETGRKA